jgi:hypothetical protein
MKTALQEQVSADEARLHAKITKNDFGPLLQILAEEGIPWQGVLRHYGLTRFGEMTLAQYGEVLYKAHDGRLKAAIEKEKACQA